LVVVLAKVSKLEVRLRLVGTQGIRRARLQVFSSSQSIEGNNGPRGIERTSHEELMGCTINASLRFAFCKIAKWLHIFPGFHASHEL
jgi:hypothetical protein